MHDNYENVPCTFATSDTAKKPAQENISVLHLDNCEELSDQQILQYIQIFEKNCRDKSIFQNCTFNNPVINLTIQK